MMYMVKIPFSLHRTFIIDILNPCIVFEKRRVCCYGLARLWEQHASAVGVWSGLRKRHVKLFARVNYYRVENGKIKLLK